MFEIDDTSFQCVAAGIGGVLVPEQLSIIECCQDPDNLNIIYIRCTITGVFVYTPSVQVQYNGNTTDITPFLIPNYKSVGVASIPIDPQAGSLTVLLAYNAGSAIPSFATIPSLLIHVQFLGQPNGLIISPLEQQSNIFISSNPSATTILNKGLLPTPYKLYFDRNTNELRIQYSDLGGTSCLCAINCVSPTEDDFQFTICQDEIQELTVSANSLVGDPTDVDITFSDSIGNTTVVQVHAMANVLPASPVALIQYDPLYINVTVPFVSINGTPIRQDKVMYQILRYENNVDNAVVWKDWTLISWKSLYDRNIRSGRTYGYAIRFKGEFGETSDLSQWAVVSVLD